MPPAREQDAADTAAPTAPRGLDLNELQEFSEKKLKALARDFDLHLHPARTRHQHILDILRAAISSGATVIAEGFVDQVSDSFGVPTAEAKVAQQNLFNELSNQEAKSSQDVSHIMDDMQAYFERRRMMKFKSVLDDMVKQDVIGGLRQLGDDLPKENGLSVAQCEYWSDTLDRWAEDLVEPAAGGT